MSEFVPYEGIGVGNRPTPDETTISVIDDSGKEIDIRPDDFWQFEADSQPSAVFVEGPKEVDIEEIREVLGGEV